MKVQLKSLGNSIGAIIPAAYIRELNLIKGSEVDITLDEGRIVIEPIKPKKRQLKFTESELIKDLTPYTAHTDELAYVSPKEMGDE